MLRTWLITSTTYGTWLPGDERGFVSNSAETSQDGELHNVPTTPYDADHPERQALAESLRKGPPVVLSAVQAEVVCEQMQAACRHRGWSLIALSVMANHFHAVVAADEAVPSADILRSLTDDASRALTQRWGKPTSGTWWTESGSRRPLYDDRAAESAANYVLHQYRCLSQFSSSPSGGCQPPDCESEASSSGALQKPPSKNNRAEKGESQEEKNTSRSGSTSSSLQTTRNQGVDTPRSDKNSRVWHPFTAMEAFFDEHAPVIERAEGFRLIDTHGRTYLDGHSSLWCNIHGHRVPELDAALREQLDRVAHSTLLGLANVPSNELAAELVRRAPRGLERVFFSDCGAAGVEAALKIVWQYHRQKPGGNDRRDRFVCLTAAYHGDTVGTISLGGIDRFHSLFGGLMFPAISIPSPGMLSTSWPPRDDAESTRLVEDYARCRAETERILTESAERIAGVVIEPLVQAAAGIRVQPPGYLKWLRELTRRLDIPLIADEIAVGFGRLGTLFACEQEEVSPDVLIVSKGMTAGYLPHAATLVTDEIYAAFLGEPWEGRTFYHGHTYTGNPLACAVALASLHLIDERDVLANARQVENVLAQAFALPERGVSTPWFDAPTPQRSNAVIRSVREGTANPELERSTIARFDHVQSGGLHPPLGEVPVRQRGTMLAIDLSLDPRTQQPFAPRLRIGHQVTLACRRRGVILRNIGDVVVLMPAPAMPIELVEQICQIVIESVAEIHRRVGGM